jgi:hypothetical protein
MKSTENAFNNFANINNNDKKKIKYRKLNSKVIKSKSQPNLFDKNSKIIKKISLSKINEESKKTTEKKLFNNANDYQFLYKDIRNSRFDVLWVKYLRNFSFSPNPIQLQGVGSAPSFYEEDLEAFKKRFNKKIKLKKINYSNDKQEIWKNLNISNEDKNKRFNEFLPPIINKDKDESNSNKNKSEIENFKNKYLHPFSYKFRKVTMTDGKVINQRYIKYDDERTLKFPSLIFSSNKYNDKCPIKNYNNIKDYLNAPNASDFVKWQSKLRDYKY